MVERNDEESVVGRIYDLGAVGTLIEVTAGEQDPSDDVPNVRPTPVVVLDRSGSMGQWAKRIITIVLPEALERAGYSADDRVCVITFDSISERVRVPSGGAAPGFLAGFKSKVSSMISGGDPSGQRDPTVAELRTLTNITCRGGTTMAPALQLLSDLLVSEPDTSFSVITISDGAVGDKDATVNAATSLVPVLEALRQAPVYCSLVRALTSSYADPDTRALACIGSISTSEAPVLDCSVWEGEAMIPALVDVVSAGVAGTGASAASFLEMCSADGSPRLHLRVPTSKGASSVRIAAGTTAYIFVDSASALDGDAPSPLPLMCRDRAIQLQAAESSEDSLGQFLGIVERTLRLWVVAGTRNADVQRTVEWFRALETHLNSIRAAAAEEVDQGDATSLSVMRRAKSLRKLVASRSRSVIGRILELANADLVASFNSQQQADFLRSGVNDGSAGRALAKRAAKHGNNGGEAACQQALASLAQQGVADTLRGLAEQEEASGAPVSFYSQSSAAECLLSGVELAPVASELRASDVLVSCGGLGVPFEAFVGDYPDPFALKILTVFAGLTLAECDLFLALQQSGSSGQTWIGCPGRPEAKITGVIPLLDVMGEQLFSLYMRVTRSIAEEQAAAQMRHLVGAKIPYDVLALSCAGAFSLFSKPERLTVDQEVLESLVKNIRFLIGDVFKEESFKSLYELLKEDDCRVHLTGANTVSSILKPVAVLLRYGATPNVDHVLRALYCFEAYQRARRYYKKEEHSRAQDLAHLLGVDFAAHATPLRPLFEQEPEDPQHHCSTEVELAGVVGRLPPWVPPVAAFESLGCFLTPGARQPLRVEADLLRSVAAVHALLSPNEAARLQLEVADPCQLEFLRERSRLLYAAEYQARAVAKAAQEAEILIQRQIDSMVNANTSAEFLGILQGCKITNRSHIKFKELMEALKVRSGVADRLHKIAYLMTGRDMQGNAVWASGNVLMGDWSDFAGAFADEPELWRRLQDIKDEYGMYRYREGGPRNRHGHGNDFPSYFAYRFQDLESFMQASDEDLVEEYVKDHKAQGCCGLNV